VEDGAAAYHSPRRCYSLAAMRDLAALLLLGLGLAGAAAAQVSPPLPIGLDGEHGFGAATLGNDVLFDGIDFSTFRLQVQTVLGADSIREVGDLRPGDPVEKIDFEDLDATVLGAVMLVIPTDTNAHAAYTSAEMDAIRAFVTAGGGLIVLAEGGGGSQVDNLNELVLPWGVGFAAAAADCTGADAIPVDHLLTAQVATIGVDCHRPISFMTGSSALDLTASGPEVLAAIEGAPGEGNVVFLSDSTLWKDTISRGDRNIFTNDNLVLLRNAVQFAYRFPDTDTDLLFDANDNCMLVANRDQHDVDGDGCGNICDCDFDQNGVCGASDLSTLRACPFGQQLPVTGPPEDPFCTEVDMDGNLVVGSGDLSLFRLGFGRPPGPGVGCP